MKISFTTPNCGIVVRSNESAGRYKSNVNTNIKTATDGTFNYVAGQPLFAGSFYADNARCGSDKLKCCE